MKCLFILMCSLLTIRLVAADVAPVYELRVYHTHPGKMPALLSRFRDHTCTLFERHGMVNVGYWLPVEARDPDTLYYVLQHASRDAAKASWTAFLADPEWKTVRDASETAGRIVARIDSTFLTATDYNPTLPKLTGGHVFELRTYVTHEGKLDALDTRFREHTLKLFEKHGMVNVLYLHPTDPDQGAGKTLIYLLAHDSVAAAKKSFDAFRVDPAWINVRDASEVNGRLLVGPPASLFLTPVDFSALQ